MVDQLTSVDYVDIKRNWETYVAREWALHAYKARLDSAIEAGRWDEVDRVRIAAKWRLIEMISGGGSENEIAAARDALADSYNRLRLSKRLRIDNGALTVAVRLSTDAETAGIGAEQAPLPQDTARDVKERIIQILSSGNRRPWTTTELAEKTARRVETVARAVSQLRAERKIASRRVGRHVLHRMVEPQRDTLANNLNSTTENQVDNKLITLSQINNAFHIWPMHTKHGADDGTGGGLMHKEQYLMPKADAPLGAERNSYLSVLKVDGEHVSSVEDMNVLFNPAV